MRGIALRKQITFTRPLAGFDGSGYQPGRRRRTAWRAVSKHFLQGRGILPNSLVKQKSAGWRCWREDDARGQFVMASRQRRPLRSGVIRRSSSRGTSRNAIAARPARRVAWAALRRFHESSPQGRSRGSTPGERPRTGCRDASEPTERLRGGQARGPRRSQSSGRLRHAFHLVGCAERRTFFVLQMQAVAMPRLVRQRTSINSRCPAASLGALPTDTI